MTQRTEPQSVKPWAGGELTLDETFAKMSDDRWLEYERRRQEIFDIFEKAHDALDRQRSIGLQHLDDIYRPTPNDVFSRMI